MPAEPAIYAERASAGSRGLVEALAQTPAGCSTAALELPPFSDESFPELEHGEAEVRTNVLNSLAETLEEQVHYNTVACCTGSGAPERTTIFHGQRLPPIGVHEYILRIAKYSRCSPVCFVMAYAYLERLAKVNSVYAPTSHSVHRLVITGVLLAAKLMDDNYFNNAFYAKIGGISVEELNRLELELLRLLNYRLLISRGEIQQHLRTLKTSLHPAVQEVKRSKKRVSESAEALGNDVALPALKYQHDDVQSEGSGLSSATDVDAGLLGIVSEASSANTAEIALEAGTY